MNKNFQFASSNMTLPANKGDVATDPESQTY